MHIRENKPPQVDVSLLVEVNETWEAESGERNAKGHS